MNYIHVKNLEKYQPGYTDRKHIWAKIYYEIFLDEAVQGLGEIDRYRFWSLIVFEVYTQKPIPLTDTNLKILGWNGRKRHISLSLQMLHTLIEVRNEQNKLSVTQSRGEESRVEEKKKRQPINYSEEFELFWKKFKGRWKPETDEYVKVGKYDAFQEWQKLTVDEQRRAWTAADRVKGEYVPDACRWLKRKLFDDFKAGN